MFRKPSFSFWRGPFAGEGSYRSQWPCQEEAQVATAPPPVSGGLCALCKVLLCPGPSAVPVQCWVCLRCAHGPGSWQKVPRGAQLKSRPNTWCRWCLGRTWVLSYLSNCTAFLRAVYLVDCGVLKWLWRLRSWDRLTLWLSPSPDFTLNILCGTFTAQMNLCLPDSIQFPEKYGVGDEKQNTKPKLIHIPWKTQCCIAR